MRKRLHPIGKELVEGKNEVMNQRLLDLLHEADDKGILDEMSMWKSIIDRCTDAESAKKFS